MENKTAKRLMVYNPKGGVGKTAIALNLALTCEYGIVTNDPSTIIEDVLPSAKCLTLSVNQKFNKPPADWPVIYDFGGFPDPRVRKVLDDSEYILIPVLPFKENIETNLNFLEELRDYKSESQIILIVNQTVRDQFEKFSEIFKTFYPLIPIFEIKKSAIFWRMISQKKSIEELARAASAAKQIYAKSFNKIESQFRVIMNFVGINCGNRQK